MVKNKFSQFPTLFIVNLIAAFWSAQAYSNVALYENLCKTQGGQYSIQFGAGTKYCAFHGFKLGDYANFDKTKATCEFKQVGSSYTVVMSANDIPLMSSPVMVKTLILSIDNVSSDGRYQGLVMGELSDSTVFREAVSCFHLE